MSAPESNESATQATNQSANQSANHSATDPVPGAARPAPEIASAALPGAGPSPDPHSDLHPDPSSVPDAIGLERICAVGWPGLVELRLGDWLLRYGDGFSGRANSVQVLGDPGLPFDEALTTVSDWYAGHGARPIYQVLVGATVPAPVADIGRQLTERGWATGDEVAVLAGGIGPVLDRITPATGLDTTVETSPGAAWLATYQYRGRPLPDHAVRVLRGGPDPVFVSVRRAGQVVAVARGVVAQGWLGVTAVTVVERARRGGIGTAVMAAVLQWGRQQGAHSAYLQVDRQNSGALAMYGRLGFHEHHGYSYRLPG